MKDPLKAALDEYQETGGDIPGFDDLVDGWSPVSVRLLQDLHKILQEIALSLKYLEGYFFVFLFFFPFDPLFSHHRSSLSNSVQGAAGGLDTTHAMPEAHASS